MTEILTLKELIKWIYIKIIIPTDVSTFTSSSKMFPFLWHPKRLILLVTLV